MSKEGSLSRMKGAYGLCTPRPRYESGLMMHEVQMHEVQARGAEERGAHPTHHKGGLVVRYSDTGDLRDS